MTELVIKQRPQNYIPDVLTQHYADGKMIQRFPGNHIVLTCDKSCGRMTVTIDNRVVGIFDNLTVADWGNILYTLETDFADKILKAS